MTDTQLLIRVDRHPLIGEEIKRIIRYAINQY